MQSICSTDCDAACTGHLDVKCEDAHPNDFDLKYFHRLLQVFQALHDNVQNKEGVTVMPILLHPKSRGTIRLNKTDPFHPPDINPNYLEYPHDINILLDGKYTDTLTWELLIVNQQWWGGGGILSQK